MSDYRTEMERIARRDRAAERRRSGMRVDGASTRDLPRVIGQRAKRKSQRSR